MAYPVGGWTPGVAENLQFRAYGWSSRHHKVSGYSDNSNLLLFLQNLGIVSYHGGSVMVELGRPGAMHPLTADSLRAALFTSGEYDRRWNPPTAGSGTTATV